MMEDGAPAPAPAAAVEAKSAEDDGTRGVYVMH